MKIEQWLKENQIIYIPQAEFLGCEGKKYPLRFDFYLPDYNTCIEFDGSQHFNKTTYFCKDPKIIEISFAKTQLYDKIKDNFCQIHNISLLRIKYDAMKQEGKIERLLYSQLKNENLKMG
jgi:very-short-patch-repair endonuclease